MSSVYLDGLSLSNFRGIGRTTRISPFRQINFFIGPNNVGKSTILHFLANYLHGKDGSRNAWERSFDPIDVRLGKTPSEISFALAMRKEEFISRTLKISNDQYQHEIKTLANILSTADNLIWVRPDESKRALEFIHDNASLATIDPRSWEQLWRFFTGQQGGSIGTWQSQTLGRLANSTSAGYPPVRFIPAIREITGTGSNFTDYSGEGLIDRLAELQNPPHDKRAERTKFDKINAFLQAVTESPEATIEVPHDRRYLLVHMDGKVLPLSSLGTGIHEVIMIASFCTLFDSEIVCVEEPEIHLHPLLQRKLISFLAAETTNQYFIATHSASVLDAVPAAIFSVEKASGETEIALAATPKERHEICKELGYRASDLLQSNAVIWVEGPSDRIYLNHWLRAIDNTLVEGIDYSIMFYGGRLLAHLTANDPEIDDFISLRKLNRNVAIIIDSDKRTPHAGINKTKTRVASEIGESFSWITAGREIENYVPVAQIQKALSLIYPRFGHIIDTGRYASRLTFNEKKTGIEVSSPDKVKVAKHIAEMPAELGELDLRPRLSELVTFIKTAVH